MTAPSGDHGSLVFERIGEYTAVLENLVQLSLRRQNTNNIFVGLNTVFLTGLGILLFSTRLASWWVVGATAAITLAILPLNVTWRTAIKRYKAGISVRKVYLQEIEEEFRKRRGTAEMGSSAPPLGLFLKIRDTSSLHQHGNTELEVRVATYFLMLYPIITIVVGILTYFVIYQAIPPLDVT